MGLGHIGKRHAEIIQTTDGAELVAVIDPAFEAARLKSLEHCRHFTSLDSFFSAGIAVNVIVIASPNGFHANQVLKVLDNGAHVIVEKPIALNVSDAKKIADKSFALKRNVFPVIQNRYSAVSVWLKELVESNKFGTIYMVQVNCYWNRDERYYSNNWRGTKELDGGTLFTQFYHFVDILFWLFGDIENIQGRFADFNHQKLSDFEDSGFVNFDFKSGGMGSINYSTSVWNRNLESSITIIGEKGSVKVGGQYMEKVEHCMVQDYQLSPSKIAEFALTAMKQNHEQVLLNVLKIMRGFPGSIPTVEEGIAVLDMITRIYSHCDILKSRSFLHIKAAAATL